MHAVALRQIASTIPSSGISRAKPSIISTASLLPETIRSRSLSSSSSCVGNGDELAVDPAQANRADRALERQRRNAQRGRGAVHGQHVAVVLAIAGQDEGLDLHFVVKPVRETAAGSGDPSAAR